MYQAPLFEPDKQWSPPETLPCLSDAGVVSIDVETCDPALRDRGPGWSRGEGHVAGVAVAVGNKSGGCEGAWYFPIAHEHGGNLDANIVKRFMRDVVRLPCPKIMFNAQYDYGWLLRWLRVHPRGAIIDPMGAAALLDENRRGRGYGLNVLAEDYLGMTKDETLLREAAKEWSFDVKKDLHRLHSAYVGPYAEQDARLNILLWDNFKQQIAKQDLKRVFKLETELIRVFVHMTGKGVRIDQDWLARSKTYLTKKKSAALKAIKQEVGFGIDPWAADSVAKAFRTIGVTDYPLTPKTRKPSFTVEWLEEHHSTLAQNLRAARKYDKVMGTYIEGMLRNHMHNGRVHPDWHPLPMDEHGAVTGRVSASNPSPQVIVKRDPEIGSLIRGAFLPEEGEEWVSADQSQQEPRWFLHFAHVAGMPGTTRYVQRYKEDPSTDYHSMVAAYSGLDRKSSKDLNQGLAYGMGKANLIRSLTHLGIQRQRAEQVYDTFHHHVPYVKALTDYVTALTERRGYVRTVLGRRRRFPLWEPANNYATQHGQPNPDYVRPATREDALRYVSEGRKGWRGAKLKRAFAYKGTNAIVQGTSADQIKQSMLDCWKAGIRGTLLQVHDELCFSNGDGEQGRERIRTIMVHSIEASIPFKVDVEHGDRWMMEEKEE